MSNKYTYAPPFTKEQLQEAYVMHGMSQVEVAQKFNTSQKVVWNALHKFGIPTRKAAKRNQRGELNHQWKGSTASYKAFHQRLYKAFGKPSFCNVCKTTDPNKTYDWANLTGKYEDMSDYARMCRSCHWIYDGRSANFKGAVGGRTAKEVHHA